MADISLRALSVLDQVDLIAAEDTRHSRRLLDHYGITTRLMSLHEHNEEQKAGQIIERIGRGQSIALISDAGTPLISDPGYVLVNRVRAHSLPVRPVPGACAMISALSVSGLPTDRFAFEGFLPAKPVARANRLEMLKEDERTLVFYESPHRVQDALKAIRNIFGDDREMVVAREITKRFETVLKGSASELCDIVELDENQRKGEFVFVVRGYRATGDELDPKAKSLLLQLVEYLPLKQAAAIVAQHYGGNKKVYYQFGVQTREKQADS
ncbi:MAG: 16S rRNA (cytidine(1402)-2'-O)-methyltransferase [Gammaproteobacteria bacterium]|nr:MAG: 16S rRNA (cytidine(1402)-2'-O)-methyltransferase [Pseudomonadota bacterium]PIE38535.1 MAG: 16S rRNA (cytidine(1402)-2'-O)-methyltransferase [Gammaproteobacteria bacterium]